MTNHVPNINHGVRFPILVLVLSIRKPTMFVAIPSAICPESKAKEAKPGPISTV